jgi:sec-independent protein translocase protein TatB
MFDFAWSEIAIIGVVALVAIGPKDMPVALRTVAGMVKKARKMASEFQTHVDEMVREADLGDLKSQINDIKNFDIKGEIEKAVDGDGTIRDAFANDPFQAAFGATGGGTAAAPAVEAKWEPPAKAPPAFIPPQIAAPPQPPAFIPPDAVRH